MMKKWIVLLTAILCLSVSGLAFAESAVTRIKDIAKVQGVRSNQLVGYGLVMGLNGTGDSNKTLEVLQSVANMLRKFGVTIDQAEERGGCGRYGYAPAFCPRGRHHRCDGLVHGRREKHTGRHLDPDAAASR